MRPSALRAMLVMALLLGGVGRAAVAERFTERLQETHAVDRGAEIVLGNTNGGVTAVAWDRDVVELVAEKQVDASSATRAREAFDKIEIIVRQVAGGLEIETRTPSAASGILDWLTGAARNASVRYELRVPAGAPLRLTTVNGNVRTAGAAGGQRLRSTNGRVGVEGARHRVEARTVNGSIDVEISGASSAIDVRLGTTNGGITLAVPDGLEARLEARTVNGSVRSDLPVAILGAMSRRRLSGDLNGGGSGRIELSTTNGGIHLRVAGD